MRYKFLFILLFCLCSALNAKSFVHPGLLHTKEDLQRIEALVRDKVYPSYGSFELLKKEPEASCGYRMRGPFENIARAGKYGYTKSPCEDDCNAAYYNSLMWNITKDISHADKAMEILRAYSGRLKEIHGLDEPLCAGLQGFMLVNAAEIMRYTYMASEYKNGWNAKDTESVEAMFRNVFLPVLETFCNTKPYSNGNWGISVNKMRLALGIFLDDGRLYDSAIDFFYNSVDNGSLPNYVSETGQIQETGRDQAHCMLGLGCLAELCECAWKQGDDLYGALGNRLMKGYEYLSKVNLGYKDVPFKVWKDATGKYCNWRNIGEAGMGEFRSVFEIAYNHYVYRCGKAMPYTDKVVKRIRPEGAGFTCDNPGFGTLLFYIGKSERVALKGEIYERLSDSCTGWIMETPALKPVGDALAIVSSGVKMKKVHIPYDAVKYPYIEVEFSALPEHCKKDWMRLSYSVNSAPEFWTFSEDDAIWKSGNTYLFKISGSLSNNGTKFSSRLENVTLLLDFGDINHVGINHIISKAAYE